MQKALATSFIVTLGMFVVVFGISGCAGRAANPVMVHQYGDENKSCQAIERELVFIESEIHRLIPESQKAVKNVALGVAGAFLLVPWFFMDLSKAEQIEINAYRQRHNHLVILAGEKDCGIEKEEIPDFQQPPSDEDKPRHSTIG